MIVKWRNFYRLCRRQRPFNLSLLLCISDCFCNLLQKNSNDKIRYSETDDTAKDVKYIAPDDEFVDEKAEDIYR